MKKNFLIICLFFIATANAQFTKGQKLVGPSFGFNFGSGKNLVTNLSTTETKSSSAGFNLGYSVLQMKSNSKAKGWSVAYSFSHNKTTNDYSTSNNATENTNHNFSIAYINRNFTAIKPKFNFYYDVAVKADVGFGNSKYSNNLPTNNADYSIANQGIGLYVTPGLTYQLKKNLLLEAALNNLGAITFNRNTSKRKENLPANSYEQTNMGFSAYSSLSAGNLLNTFTFSLKWIIN